MLAMRNGLHNLSPKSYRLHEPDILGALISIIFYRMYYYFLTACKFLPDRPLPNSRPYFENVPSVFTAEGMGICSYMKSMHFESSR